MSRLLFAAARGARIGWKTFSGKWHPALSLNGVQSECGQDAYRIHPNDAHLQYGPVSTALREMAADNSWNPNSYRVLAVAAANEFQVYLGGVRDDYPLFYLFLAEFLADEGM
jgi:hypothetical protein